MKRIAVATVLVAIGGACTSFDDADEAAPSRPDTGADAAAADAGEGAADAADDAPGDAANDAGHTFFDDFDHGELGSTWTSTVIAQPVTFALDATEAFSKPAALRAAFPAGVGDYFTGSFLSKRFNGSVRSLACGAHAFVEKHTGKASPSIVDLRFVVPNGAGFTDANVVLSVNELRVSMAVNQGGAGEPTYPWTPAALPTEKWLALRIAIDVDAHDVSVTVDGATYLEGTFPAVLRPNAGFDFKLGLFESSDEDSAAIRFDDAACDVVFD